MLSVQQTKLPCFYLFQWRTNASRSRGDVVPTMSTGKAVVIARLDTSGVMRLAHSVSTVSRPNGDALSQAPPLLSTFEYPDYLRQG